MILDRRAWIWIGIVGGAAALVGGMVICLLMVNAMAPKVKELRVAFESKTAVPEDVDEPTVAPYLMGSYQSAEESPPPLAIGVEIDDVTAVYANGGEPVYLYYEAAGGEESGDPWPAAVRAVKDATKTCLSSEIESIRFARGTLTDSGRSIWMWVNGGHVFAVTSSDAGSAAAFVREYPY